MKEFSNLYLALEQTSDPSAQTAAMVDYFKTAAPEDAVWTVYLLAGRWTGRLIPSRDLKRWAMKASRLPQWLFDESCRAVGDTAEAAALLAPEANPASDLPLHYWLERRIVPLCTISPARHEEAVLRAWSELGIDERLVWNKLVSGSFRTAVTRKRLGEALAEFSGLDSRLLLHRLSVEWQPSSTRFRHIVSSDATAADRSRTYPFCLANRIDILPSGLGSRDGWQAEWMWDGVRAQIVRRGGHVFIWSRHSELITDRYPEIRDSAQTLPDGAVLDGSLVAFRKGKPLPYARLQRRLGKKNVSKSLLREIPVSFLAYDLLEWDGADMRAMPLHERRTMLERVLRRPSLRIRCAPKIDAVDWEAVAALHQECRQRLTRGMIFKHLSAPYVEGRERGIWWKWPIRPLSIDAVLVYAETGERRDDFTYTFGVWDDGELVPFATTSAGPALDDARDIVQYVEEHTVDRFGPVRSVEAGLVFEIAFDDVLPAKARKSGVSVRSPRVVRQRTGMAVDDAGTAATLRELADRHAKTDTAHASGAGTLELF